MSGEGALTAGVGKLLVESLLWDKVQGGLKLVWSYSGASSAQKGKTTLYWAKGPKFDDRLAAIPFAATEISVQKTGLYINRWGKDVLRDSPPNTTTIHVCMDEEKVLIGVDHVDFAPVADVEIQFRRPTRDNNSDLSDYTRQVLKEILRGAGQRIGMIERTASSPRHQAEVMFDNLQADNLSQLETPPRQTSSNYGIPGQDVEDIYFTAVSVLTTQQPLITPQQIVDGMKPQKKAIVDAMEAQIIKSPPNKVSKHCADFNEVNVVDFSPQFFTLAGRFQFMYATLDESRVQKFLWPDGRLIGRLPQDFDPQVAARVRMNPSPGADGAFHLEIPQTEVRLATTGSVAARSGNPASSMRLQGFGDSVQSIAFTDGEGIADGEVSDRHRVFSYPADAGDLLQLAVGVTEERQGRTFNNDRTMVFLYDQSGRLLTSKDRDENDIYSSLIENFVIPSTGTYYVAVTTWRNLPLLQNGRIIGWEDDGEGSVAFQVYASITQATPTPSIAAGPESQTAVVGASVTFKVTAIGIAPLSYQWRKNGVNIAGATTATYTISSAQASDAGSYSVVVRNVAGSAISNAAALTVTTLTAPSITSHPQNQTVTAGQSVTFNVVATGNPAPAYQWRKNGVNIAGASTATYRIPSAQPSDAGSYSVFVSNSAGSKTSMSAVLTVETVPVLPTINVLQPSDAIIASTANSPASEGVANAIDHSRAKYLNFDMANDAIPSGFIVTPAVGPTIISGISIQSANDSPERDPRSFTLDGSNDADASYARGTWTTIYSNANVPDWSMTFPGDTRYQTQTFYFSNTTAYKSYRWTLILA